MLFDNAARIMTRDAHKHMTATQEQIWNTAVPEAPKQVTIEAHFLGRKKDPATVGGHGFGPKCWSRKRPPKNAHFLQKLAELCDL